MSNLLKKYSPLDEIFSDDTTYDSPMATLEAYAIIVGCSHFRGHFSPWRKKPLVQKQSGAQKQLIVTAERNNPAQAAELAAAVLGVFKRLGDPQDTIASAMGTLNAAFNYPLRTFWNVRSFRGCNSAITAGTLNVDGKLENEIDVTPDMSKIDYDGNNSDILNPIREALMQGKALAITTDASSLNRTCEAIANALPQIKSNIRKILPQCNEDEYMQAIKMLGYADYTHKHVNRILIREGAQLC